MKAPTKDMFSYLKGERVGVLAIEMLDGSPHAATVHFAHREEPFLFIFETDRKYRKSEPLLGRSTSRASFVVGSNEGDMKTFQFDGMASLSQEGSLKEIYLEKFSEKREKTNGPDVVFFSFTPTWWRFTDWTRPEGKTVYVSDGTIEVKK